MPAKSYSTSWFLDHADFLQSMVASGLGPDFLINDAGKETPKSNLLGSNQGGSVPVNGVLAEPTELYLLNWF